MGIEQCRQTVRARAYSHRGFRSRPESDNEDKAKEQLVENRNSYPETFGQACKMLRAVEDSEPFEVQRDILVSFEKKPIKIEKVKAKKEFSNNKLKRVVSLEEPEIRLPAEKPRASKLHKGNINVFLTKNDQREKSSNQVHNRSKAHFCHNTIVVVPQRKKLVVPPLNLGFIKKHLRSPRGGTANRKDLPEPSRMHYSTMHLIRKKPKIIISPKEEDKRVFFPRKCGSQRKINKDLTPRDIFN